MMTETYKNRKIRYLQTFFKEYAEKWKDNMKDDRLVFCNMYNQMIRAFESLPDEPDNYVCVAMNDKFSKDCEILKRIRDYFKDRED